MKLYLDDERETPAGCVRVFWPDEAIAWLKTGAVTEISLDHDLGDDNRGTGYDVILWIEKEVMTNHFIPPLIRVHSANVSARSKMELGIMAINHFLAKPSRLAPDDTNCVR
ncbi:cyclic-phosphate processing receiver domain-containing protein [Aeromonas dhakensis]|uniref:cyclic-phosphate processing receiver domain-containing protein n=1 Tax=Aeromonas dhakensis TaxID=196024 RepID=UPI0009DFCD38|nr:cyclic-phosphate processing receiver domain-containing protein [Aeromonas dhakensis]